MKNVNEKLSKTNESVEWIFGITVNVLSQFSQMEISLKIVQFLHGNLGNPIP